MAKNSKKYKIKKTKLTKKLSLTYLLKKRPLEFTLAFTAFVVVALYSAWATISGEINVLARTPLPIEEFSSTYNGYNPSLASKAGYTPAQKCTVKNGIVGARPAIAGNYPVLVYVHGTFGNLSGNAEGKAFVKWAAAQGFTALALTYNSTFTNSDSGYAGHAYCMFDQNHASNGVAQSCKALKADCTNGILVAGFSQGAVIGAMSKNYAPNVKAVWAIGLSAAILPSNKLPGYLVAPPAGTRALPNNKLVINMGQTSSCGGKVLCSYDLPSLKSMTGLNCGESYNCVQNGYGYYVISNSEVADGKADHCYWEGNSGCRVSGFTGEVGFKPPSLTAWSMIRNLDWLRAQ